MEDFEEEKGEKGSYALAGHICSLVERDWWSQSKGRKSNSEDIAITDIQNTEDTGAGVPVVRKMWR